MRPLIFPFPHSLEKTHSCSYLFWSSNACTTRDDILPRCSFHGGFILALQSATAMFCREPPGYNGVSMGPFPAQKETKPIKLIKPSTVYIYINIKNISCTILWYHRMSVYKNKYAHMCVYKCMYVCMYACIYVSMYLCIYVCMYACMYVCMCVYVCMYISMYLCTYVCIYVCIYVSMYVCMYLCMYLCIYVCIYVSMYVCMDTTPERWDLSQHKRKPNQSN